MTQKDRIDLIETKTYNALNSVEFGDWSLLEDDIPWLIGQLNTTRMLLDGALAALDQSLANDDKGGDLK